LRTRSLITVAMLIALRAHSELEIHAPAAIRNGATVAELEEVIYQSAGYAGFPAAASARDVVREALQEAGMLS
jgi:4-carboxymuconolactone decarboxylase